MKDPFTLSSEEDVATMPGQHKRSKCTVCGKSMRSDNVKGHMKMHKDLLSLPEEEVKEELRARHATQLEREAKRQQIEEIARGEGLSIPQEISDTQPLDKENLRENLLRDNQLYVEKIELGKNISSIMDEGIVREESLTKERKLALDLYRRQEPRFDISLVQLRAWQEAALKLFESPTERQVIWITGRQGYEGKSYFQSYVESYFGYHRVARVDLRKKVPQKVPQ